MEDSQVYVVLRSIENTYVFDTFIWPRPDVTETFEYLDLNLDNAGFIARIPMHKIKDGTYTVGFYIKKGAIESLQYIDKAIVKSKDVVKPTFVLSTPQEIMLPAESGGIRLAIDSHKVIKDEEEKGLAEIAGWAFIEGQSTDDSKIYVALKSETATYVFDTILQVRTDVTAAFADTGLNLDKAGFMARVAKENIEAGIYKVGIYIEKGDVEVLQYTDVKIGLRVPGESRVQDISLPAVTDNIQYHVDHFDVSTHVIEINGWAFIKGEDCEDIEHYLVLKSDDNTYIFDTTPVPRRDVTQHFKGLYLNLDYSGYTALIPARKIANGEYTIGIYIRKGEIEALRYTGRSIVKARGAIETG